MSSSLCVQVTEFNHIDIANVMCGLVGVKHAPAVQALDVLADHVNMHYAQYTPVEMTQVLYGFARMSFHPGAVVGRVLVVFNLYPDIFDANSHRLLTYTLAVLDRQSIPMASTFSPQETSGASGAAMLMAWNSSKENAA
jgi:hypothetical protein